MTAFKPETKIYEILLQKNNLNPADCIFIDDKLTNLQPAQRLGMTVIHFLNAEQLQAELTLLLAK